MRTKRNVKMKMSVRERARKEGKLGIDTRIKMNGYNNSKSNNNKSNNHIKYGSNEVMQLQSLVVFVRPHKIAAVRASDHLNFSVAEIWFNSFCLTSIAGGIPNGILLQYFARAKCTVTFSVVAVSPNPFSDIQTKWPVFSPYFIEFCLSISIFISLNYLFK